MEAQQRSGTECFGSNILAVNIVLFKTNEALQRGSDI